MVESVNPRRLSLDLLLEITDRREYSQLALNTALSRYPLNEMDRGLVTKLVYGVLETMPTLDYQWKLKTEKKPDRVTIMCLRLGYYQLAFCQKLPPYAVIDETVRLSPRSTKGMVNALLRQFQRDNFLLQYPDKKDNGHYLSVKYGFPTSLVHLFHREFGEKTEDILSAFTMPQKEYLRVNTLKTTREQLLSLLKEEGYAVSPVADNENGITLEKGNIPELIRRHPGAFLVQGAEAQTCVDAMGVRAGMKVLDACSAPGTKATAMAMAMGNKGEILACDLHENKLSLIEENFENMGVTIGTVQEQDATVYRAEWEKQFDAVLCDVPCSGLGILGNKPEIRYRDLKETEALPPLQTAILENCSRYVKEGGTLMYATCTILSRENGEVVKAFSKKHPEFRIHRECLTLPSEGHRDGFYFCKLLRQS